MSHLTTEKLNATERSEWKKQLGIVEKNRENFWSIVDAVAVIRKQRLYRQDYNTFDEFVEQRVGLTVRYTNKLIEASEARKKLGTIVPKEDAEKFENPHQLQALAEVPDEELPAVVSEVIEQADGKKITASGIKDVIESRNNTAQRVRDAEKVDVVSTEPIDHEVEQVAESPKSEPVQDISQEEIEEAKVEQERRNAVSFDESIVGPDVRLRALLNQMDPVDALGIVLEAIGPVEDQAMILAQTQVALVDALKGLA